MSRIIGLGYYAPEKVYDNAYMESIVETSDEWITQRTGIKERHIAADDEFTSDLATKAAQNALKDAGITAEELDLIILTTVTPDYFTPSTACVVQKNIGAVNAAAFDLNAACSGFATAMTVADQFLSNGTYKKVLVVSADALSKATDYADRGTCVLFGDGAGAVILSDEKGGILSTWIGAKGEGGDKLTALAYREDAEETEKRVSHNKNTVWMAGGEVMKFAVKIMAEAAEKVVADAGLTWDDIDIIIPHQANMRIVESAAKRMGISTDRMFINLDRYGNTSGASIPIALCEARDAGRLKKGDKAVLVGFGGGLTWAASVIEY
ncbi:MAG: beta-ketoacyl-ACP synthase III [Clostridia bacterium]|nr:beta-ketoacyl-ACP synthase III [Clostridia bacterium]